MQEKSNCRTPENSRCTAELKDLVGSCNHNSVQKEASCLLNTASTVDKSAVATLESSGEVSVCNKEELPASVIKDSELSVLLEGQKFVKKQDPKYSVNQNNQFAATQLFGIPIEHGVSSIWTDNFEIDPQFKSDIVCGNLSKSFNITTESNANGPKSARLTVTGERRLDAHVNYKSVSSPSNRLFFQHIKVCHYFTKLLNVCFPSSVCFLKVVIYFANFILSLFYLTALKISIFLYFL